MASDTHLWPVYMILMLSGRTGKDRFVLCVECVNVLHMKNHKKDRVIINILLFLDCFVVGEGGKGWLALGYARSGSISRIERSMHKSNKT